MELCITGSLQELLKSNFSLSLPLSLQVYYVDHGFSEVVNKTKVFELHEKFFQLPFQATKCKLAGASRRIRSVV